MGLFIGCLLSSCFIALLNLPSSGHGATNLAPLHHRDSVGRPDVLEESFQSTDAEMEALEDSVKIMSLSKEKRSVSAMPSIGKCLGLPSWIANPMQRWFGPKMDSGVPATFFLSTRSHRARYEILTGVNFTTSSMEGFDASHRTVVIVHGFMRAGEADWVKDMADAFLDKADVNVISVYWQNAEGLLKYWKTVASMQNVANEVQRFLEQLTDKVGLRTKDLHLVGHCLGAHICGYVGRSLGNVLRITGLDPVQPCFTGSSAILSVADAKFVDVIHTNGRMLKKLNIVLPYEVGHVDFFPKGGLLLPECQETKKTSWKARAWSLLHSTSYKLYQKLSESICSRGQAHSLFTESIRKSTSCVFWGHPWNMRNETVEDVFNRPCNMRHCSEMGYNSDLYPARGGFYVKATETPPYCVPDQKTDAEMTTSDAEMTTSDVGY